MTMIPSMYGVSGVVSPDTELVLRPRHHAQGRHVYLVRGLDGVTEAINAHPHVFANGWYASEYIRKVAEYRYYVVSGRIVTVARKTPENPDAVAWNVAQGGRFDVVRWGDWDMEGARVALEAFKHSGLDFSGVDVMVDENCRAYVIELNSAPSLPLLSDGSRSYRQECMAKAFRYIYHNGKEFFPEVQEFNGWRDVIHPAVTGD